jgi:hypothetical protein
VCVKTKDVFHCIIVRLRMYLHIISTFMQWVYSLPPKTSLYIVKTGLNQIITKENASLPQQTKSEFDYSLNYIFKRKKLERSCSSCIWVTLSKRVENTVMWDSREFEFHRGSPLPGLSHKSTTLACITLGIKGQRHCGHVGTNVNQYDRHFRKKGY